MENIREFYFFGQPIETEIGTIHFLKVNEYTKLFRYIPYLNLEKFEVLNLLNNLDKDATQFFQDLPYIDILKELRTVLDVHSMLKELFILCFKEDVFDKIQTDEELDYYTTLIREMNCVHRERKSPNPEIERFNQFKKLHAKKKSGGDITLESMLSSVWLYTGKDVSDLTIYQLYALFNRIQQFKSYDTTILYNSVSGNIPIEMWFKHVDMFDRKETLLTTDEFTEYAKKIMNN